MNKKLKLKLIDGNFSSQDGKDLLMNLFSSKISFHQMKNFSSNERFGKDDELAAKKIPVLKESKRFIADLFEEALAENKNFKLTSNITIELVTPKKRNVQK